MIHDAGVQFRYTTDRMLRRGEFDLFTYKVLVLPLTFAIGHREADLVREFVRQGGTLIADVRPGIYDGHCKPQAVGMLGVHQQVALRVGVRIDETGRDRQSGGVDKPARLGAGQVADGLNPIPGYADVVAESGCLRAVDHGPAADHDVEHWPVTPIFPVRAEFRLEVV